MSILKTAIIWLMINCFAKCTYSQSTYNLIYDISEHFADWAGNIQILDDGNILIQGSTYFYDVDGYPWYGVYSNSYDMGTGDIIQEYHITYDDTLFASGYPGSLQKLELGFINAGYMQWGDTLDPFNILSRSVLYRFDENEDTLWAKNFSGLGYSVGYYCTKSVDSGFLLVGYSHHENIPDPKIYLVKTDSLGNLIWEHYYGPGGWNFGYSVATYKNGNILLGGQTNGTFNGLYDGCIYKLNSNGDVLWEKNLGTIGADGGCLVKISEDENHLYMFQTLDTIINESDCERPNYIAKLDSNGNYIWQTFLNDTTCIDVWNIVELSDKNFIFCGVRNNEAGYYRGYICKLDSNGSKIWERTYFARDDEDNYLINVLQAPDNGFILTGIAFSATDQDMWLLKLDSMGCLLPGCADSAMINPPDIPDAAFMIYPNPVSGTSTVEVSIATDFIPIDGENLTLLLFDISGKLVDSYSNIMVHNPNEIIRFNIYKKNLAAGIYQAVLMYGGNNLGIIKLGVI